MGQSLSFSGEFIFFTLSSKIRGAKPMGLFDTMLQHFVYKKKYSKLKDNNK